MRFFSVIVFAFCVFACSEQNTSSQLPTTLHNSPTRFRLSIVSFNHASQLVDGITTYVVTDSILQVKKTFPGDTTSKVVYSKPIQLNQAQMAVIDKIVSDSLDEYYTTNCVLATSGDEYDINYQTDSRQKRIHLHHYYLQQVDEIKQIINVHLPEKYQFQYLPKDTQQDCPL
ncbi:hypothetical protein [Xanthocytophaga agilis]|uniref:Uncharacterized protein n=1 Tax=Xanthocytophaga agilis TaxID=3048010 RepID=A0AAE3R1M1_9BACT|nr:hypothetical protein [Xanthocytophaga agilis]MDJ1502064.1 hypothetical protein [Xanthocytophaga agilis]